MIFTAPQPTDKEIASIRSEVYKGHVVITPSGNQPDKIQELDNIFDSYKGEFLQTGWVDCGGESLRITTNASTLIDA